MQKHKIAETATITACAQSLRQLSQPQAISESTQLSAYAGSATCIKHVAQVLKIQHKSEETMPLQLMMAVYADSAEDMTARKFCQTSIIACDENNQSVTLAHPQGQSV